MRPILSSPVIDATSDGEQSRMKNSKNGLKSILLLTMETIEHGDRQNRYDVLAL